MTVPGNRRSPRIASSRAASAWARSRSTVPISTGVKCAPRKAGAMSSCAGVTVPWKRSCPRPSATARDQLLYRLAPDNPPQAITVGADKRYADGVIDRRHHRILCVCEDHSAGGEPVNTIVSIDPEGRREARGLVAGGGLCL